MKTTRSSGIILHITSLPGPYGIGDLGPEAYKFADFLAACGFSYWQLLPLNPAEKRNGYSPYSSTSAFAGNTMLISPDLLVKDGFLTRNQLQFKQKIKGDRVDFAEVYAFKKGLLRQVFRQFKSGTEGKFYKSFHKFQTDQKDWLEDYALFKVIDELHGQASWQEWEKPLREREPEALAEILQENREEVEYYKFCQYLFYRQLADLRAYCHEKQIRFFGDLPFYVSFDSADVWANPENFKLDEARNPTVVSGVPPDYFSETGQLWGTPVYDWEQLRKNNYSWWMSRLAHNLELFDVVRLDHFRAFYDYWEVKAGEPTAVQGTWQKGPAAAFFNVLKKKFPEIPFIAEDLGEVGPGVYALRDQFNLPGMVVLQYAFGPDIATSVFALHNHQHNQIAYTGTHDNNTARGWYKQELNPEDKQRMNAYLNQKISVSNVSQALIKAVLMSVASVAIIPLQDFLDLDEKGLMNRPSVAEGNWRWRVTETQIKSLDPQKIRDLLALYNRAITNKTNSGK